MHSTSRLTFDIPDGYSTFEAELALAADAEGKSLGSVQYRVFLKTRMGWKEVFKSPIVRQSLHEVECRVPLRFAEEIATAISLVVDFADRIDQGDHALWLDARLVR